MILMKRNNKIKYNILLLMTICLIIIDKLLIKNIKICLCAIAKNENLYLEEFVEKYKNIRYNNIFIYDNNYINEENINETISDYIQTCFVKITFIITSNKKIIYYFIIHTINSIIHTIKNK